MKDNEIELPGLLAADRHQHFLSLVLCYQHQLYSFALHLTGSAQDAEDLVQEAFVRAYAALLNYEPLRIQMLRLRPWLYKITLNVYRHWRRVPHLQVLPLDLSEDGPVLALPDEELAQPEVLLEEQEQREEEQERLQRLMRLMAQLPEPYRVALTCYYVEQLSYQEIADLLEQPLGTVKSTLFRGVRLLRARWQDHQVGREESVWKIRHNQA